MKIILFFVVAVIFTNVFSGCVNPGPAPQDVQLQNPDGKAVIIKDMYSLPLIENKKLKETEIVKIFFPKADNVRMKCSMTLIKIPSGVQPPKYKQTSAQIIYAISGGGKMNIDGNMIILKKGIMVYVPPNVAMSIINNVNSILELVIVTSPPFETSQMTMLEEKTKKVVVSKDLENSMNNDDGDYQAVSEKYRTSKKRSKRIDSIEEYRTRMNKDLLPDPDAKDPIADLLKDAKDETTPKIEDPNDLNVLRMPDNSKVPLKKLEQEQEQQLIPKTPQKAEKTSLKHIQDLTVEEHKVPIDKNKSEPGKVKIDSSENDQDSLEKLLNDQKKQQEKLIPKKALKAKKTSLKHIQKLEPEENVPTKSDSKTTL